MSICYVCKKFGSFKGLVHLGHAVDRIKKNGMGEAFETFRDRRGAYRVLVGRNDRRRPFGRPRCSWLDYIKMDLQKVFWGAMDWIDLAWDMDRWRAFVNAVMNLRVP
jgi:hypothetical protein